MPDEIEIQQQDSPPDADLISTLRDRARSRGNAVGISFPADDAQRKRLVASPRGTCVLLTDTTEKTFNQSVASQEISDQLRT